MLLIYMSIQVTSFRGYNTMQKDDKYGVCINEIMSYRDKKLWNKL